MGLTDNLSRVSSRVNSEQLMLIFMLLVSVYMFIGSYSFSWAAAFFPRFTATMTIVGASLLLFRKYLPSFLREYVSTSVSIVGEDVRTETGEDFAEGTEENGVDEDVRMETGEDTEESDGSEELLWGSNGGLITVLLMGGYIFTSYLVGMLWVTPVFVALYLVWFRVRWIYAAVISGLAFALAYTFMRILLIDIDSGILFDGGALL